MALSWKDIPDAPRDGMVLARLEDIADGGACLLSLGQAVRPFQIILLRSGDKAFAYVNRCMHFGVPLASKVENLGVLPHQSIRCSVHYARYRWHDGFCEWGDCEGESLITIPVAVVAGNVVIADIDVSIHAPEGANLKELTPLPNEFYPPEGGGFKPELVLDQPNSPRQ